MCIMAERVAEILKKRTKVKLFTDALLWYGQTISDIGRDIKQYDAFGIIPQYVASYCNHLVYTNQQENTADDIYPAIVARGGDVS